MVCELEYLVLGRGGCLIVVLGILTPDVAFVLAAIEISVLLNFDGNFVICFLRNFNFVKILFPLDVLSLERVRPTRLILLPKQILPLV